MLAAHLRIPRLIKSSNKRKHKPFRSYPLERTVGPTNSPPFAFYPLEKRPQHSKQGADHLPTPSPTPATPALGRAAAKVRRSADAALSSTTP